jgi:putative membrane protein
MPALPLSMTSIGPLDHRNRLPLALLAITLALLVWSGIHPFELRTWALEVFPAVFAIVIILATHKRFPLTPLVLILIAFHCAILIVGGHYTYARVPVGLWAQEAFDLSRNHYDRVAHFIQGFVPAMIAREILIRRSPLQPSKWLFFLVASVCLAISAAYELLEWAVAEFDHAGSQDFLGTQGDIWDTQKDMALCGIGAITAQLLLNSLHNKQLRAQGSLKN